MKTIFIMMHHINKEIEGDMKNSLCRIGLCLFILFLFCIPIDSLAQRIKIDSLKHTLSTLQKTDRVNVLNTLSLAYLYLDADTAWSYAHKAFSEASLAHYDHGKAESLNNQARIAGYDFLDFPLQEKICLQVIQLCKGLDDDQALSEAYMNQALSLFCQSLFNDAKVACTRVAEISKKTGNRKILGEAIALMGSIDFESGNYDKSFTHFDESLQIFKEIKDTHNAAIMLVKIGDLYRLAGDHKTALEFYYQGLEFKKGSSLVWHPLVDLGDTYYSFEQYDSSLFDQDEYGQTIKLLTIRSNNGTFGRIRKAEKYMVLKEYGKALAILMEDWRRLKEGNSTNYAMRLLLDMANAFQAMNDSRSAFVYVNGLLKMATKHNAKQYMRDAYHLKFNLFDQLHKSDSTYFYYRNYSNMKNSLALDEVNRKLTLYKVVSENEKARAKIELLSNEKRMSQQQLEMSKQQIHTESFQKRALIMGVFFLLSFGFILFRNVLLKKRNEKHRHALVERELSLQKMESERMKSELQQRALELEMQALRAQMNPHFIFNSLSSINRFILKNDRIRASEYLTMFSKLIRMILQNSQVPLISLESELESLQLYLELERIRFEDHFDFKIEVHPDVDPSLINVPPLIIQPYAENSIWHGLMHKENKGHLQIELFMENSLLCCKITDDGIGRDRAMLLKKKLTSNHQSVGMRISAERIANLYHENERNAFVSITDLILADGSSGGTEVCLKIPIQYG